MFFGIIFGALALIAAVMYRARRRRRAALLAATLITDDMVRQIEQSGYVDVDEPLDLEQIQEEETRFWNEASWEDLDEV